MLETKDTMNMEPRKLIDMLRATIDPNQRQQAEEQLGQVRQTCALCVSKKFMLLLFAGSQNYRICTIITSSCYDERM